MNVIKRSGEEVVFDASKIENAIKKANKATTHNQMTDELIHSVTQSVIDKCENLKRSPNVEEIQDMVERIDGTSLFCGSSQLYHISL